MNEANDRLDPDVPQGWRWDVALSFAGEHRDYVDQVAQALKARGVRCFYDADEEIELWGKYLVEELPAIYGEQAAAVVIFVSAEYAARDWTRAERRASLGRAVRERREYVLPARFDDTPLPGLVPGVSYIDLGDRTPQQFAAMVAAKLTDLGIISSLSAREAGSRPPGGIPLSEADPRRLGVHAAIRVPGVPDEVPPAYVSRDADAAEHGIRARVAAAAERGGFVLLTGGSSVGKTRSAVEAVRALLPDWWLVHPAGPGEVMALAAAPSPRTLVWLDELQRYLEGEDGLTSAVIRALLNPPHPAVIIATMWPDSYSVYTSLPASDSVDPHVRKRQVLDLADVIRIGATFSQAEQQRAHAAAAHDPRLRIALATADYGLTQTLAAAPQLVARWQDAETSNPYAWALLTAALDVARLGARAPLTAGFLCAAAPGYCTSQQKAEAPENWFEQALAYATGKLHGTAAALSRAGTGMGQIGGYTIADYLLQHATRERRYARLPASTWDAVLSHIRNPADAVRLAESARNRLLYCYAIPLYRHTAHTGDRNAACQLDELLAQRGDLDGLRVRAGASDGYAALLLAAQLTERGDLDDAERILRSRAAVNDRSASGQLAELLAERGDLDGLRVLADAGSEAAARQLAGLLAERGDLDGLRARASAGDGPAARQLAELLAECGDLDGAEQTLRAAASAGSKSADLRLADLLAERGDLERPRTRHDASDQPAPCEPARSKDLDEMRARACAGDGDATWRLAGLLAERGDVDGAEQILRAAADGGSEAAALQLAMQVAERGDLDGAEQVLRPRADAGNRNATRLLADLLARRGDVDGLRRLIAAGSGPAARLLAELLARQGRREEALRLRQFGMNPDGSIADR